MATREGQRDLAVEEVDLAGRETVRQQRLLSDRVASVLALVNQAIASQDPTMLDAARFEADGLSLQSPEAAIAQGMATGALSEANTRLLLQNIQTQARMIEQAEASKVITPDQAAAMRQTIVENVDAILDKAESKKGKGPEDIARIDSEVEAMIRQTTPSNLINRAERETVISQMQGESLLDVSKKVMASQSEPSIDIQETSRDRLSNLRPTQPQDDATRALLAKFKVGHDGGRLV